MNCMKCGTEIENGKVFCERCLTDMDKYPVKPGTRILLPNHPAPEAAKKQAPKKRPLSTKEKLKRTQQVLKWMTVALVVSLLLLVFSIYMLFEETHRLIPRTTLVRTTVQLASTDTPTDVSRETFRKRMCLRAALFHVKQWVIL